MDDVVRLAQDLVSIDSRSSVSNLALADRIEASLAGFTVERLDYLDPAGIAKRVLVANRGGAGGLALSGHMDTVPDTGWTENPWSARIADGSLHGLGSADMKGPLAACIVAAQSLPDGVPVSLLITTDEETGKDGARLIVARSELIRRIRPVGIIVAEPTRMRPVRGHRSHVVFGVTAKGIQAHSSTGAGRNANWDLVEFLAEMKAIYLRLRSDPTMQDAAYDPPFSDFNLIIDNHGAAVNVTVPLSTVGIKYRYSASIDPEIVVKAVHAAADRYGLDVTEAREGHPPELPAGHDLVRLVEAATGCPAQTAPYGTDASELQAIAPCIVAGPGDIGVAHAPGEYIRVDELRAAQSIFAAMCRA